jgi:sugar lactone lactonase YvrE
MGLCFVLVALCVFLGSAVSTVIHAKSTDTAPVLTTIYSGPFAPTGIWSDADGNIYGCETAFHSVFKVTSGGVKTDFAGTRGTSGSATEGESVLAALFNSPRAVWADDEFLYVTDSVNNRIRRISWTTSLVTTIVGGGAGSIPLTGVVAGTSIALTLPNAITGSSNGMVYFANFDHIFMLMPSTGLVGNVGFIAGGGDHIGTFAHGDLASLSDIQGLAVDPTNNNFLFVADSGNKVVRKMDLTTGNSIIFAGRVKKENYRLPSKLYENGAVPYEITFGTPSSVWVDSNGNVFIYDSRYHIISVARHNKIYLFAGEWQYADPANILMTGPANQVHIQVSQIFGDSSKGILYLSDGTRGAIQQISPLTVNVYAPPPTISPSETPTDIPTATATTSPSASPTDTPTGIPTSVPTESPTEIPTATPTGVPTETPTEAPSTTPTVTPTETPSAIPTETPTETPSATPTSGPTETPTEPPSTTPTVTPTETPTETPSAIPSATPTSGPTEIPTETPSATPTVIPTEIPSAIPTEVPTENPTETPSTIPTVIPTEAPTNIPTVLPTVVPTASPTSFVPIISKMVNLDAVLTIPRGIWTDFSGNIFVSDSTNRIFFQSIDDSTVTTFAGTTTAGFAGDGLTLSNARFNNPQGIWGDRNYFYICDSGNNRIRALNWNTNVITTLVGGGTQTISPTTPKDANSVVLTTPISIWGDGAGNIYITSTDKKLYLFTPANGKIIHFAYGGTNLGANTAGTNGPEVPFLELATTETTVDYGYLVVSGDNSRNCLYVVEPYPSVLRKLDLLTKKGTIIAGIHSSFGPVIINGALATATQFNNMRAHFVAANGLIFLTDDYNYQVSVVNPVTGKIYKVAGTQNNFEPAGLRANNDPTNLLGIGGDPLIAKIRPYLLWGDNLRNRLYVTDRDHASVRMIQPLSLPPSAGSNRRKLEETCLPHQNVRLRGSMRQY